MWATILTVAVQLLGWILTKSGASNKAKRRFFEFVKQAGKEISSVKLAKMAEKQLKQFENEPFKPEPGQKSE